MSCGTTTKILLVGSGKYPRGGPWTWISLKCASMFLILPPTPVSSVYHVWVTRGCESRSSQMRGKTPIPYAIMARGTSWVMTSLLWKKWTDPSKTRTTMVAQWQQQLNVNYKPLGNFCYTSQSMVLEYKLTTDSTKVAVRISKRLRKGFIINKMYHLHSNSVRHSNVWFSFRLKWP